MTISDIRTFTKLASKEQKKVKVQKDGSIKITDRRIRKRVGLNFFHNKNKETKETEFAYYVIKAVIEKLENNQLSQETQEKVRKASKAICKSFKEDWKELTEEEKEDFLRLPSHFSLNCMENSELQKNAGIDLLNNRIHNGIGADLDRLISGQTFILRLPEKALIPKFKSLESIKEMVELLSNAFQLSDNLKQKFLLTCKKINKGRIFETFLGKKLHLEEEEYDELEGLRYLLNGVSQLQYQHTSTILTRIFSQSERVKLAVGSHDNVLMRFHDDRTVVVRHFFELAIKDTPQAIFRVDTESVFSLHSEKWISNTITFTSAPEVPLQVKKMQARLKKLGY